MELNNLNTQEYNTNKSLNATKPPLPNGWYCLELESESEEKETKKAGLYGQVFTFRVFGGDHDGEQVSQWFATRARFAKDSWSVENSMALFCRIAKCCGIKIVRNTAQLEKIKFFAYLTQVENKRTITELDDKDDEIKKEIKVVNSTFSGNLNEIILSAEEFEDKHASPEKQDLNDSTPKKKFVKKNVTKTEEHNAATGDDEEDETQNATENDWA